MQFTPQQLSGGPKFSAVTRIGNWFEDLAMEEAKNTNFEKRSNNGNLSLRKLQNKVSACCAIVPHSYSADGLIRFGDSVILQHDSSGSVLASDIFEEVEVGQEKFFVTTISEKPVPKARNTFKIVRPPAHLINREDNTNDPVLHIGQAFLIACDDSLLVNPYSNILSPTLYLTSTKKNDRTSTKRTNRQMVYMSAEISADTVWTAIIPSQGKFNASARFLSVGQNLPISECFQITHRQTNMYLTCDPKSAISTEFGVEYECYADRSAASGKLSLIVSEFQGLSTSQTLSKPDAPSFSWHFVVTNDQNASVDNRDLPKPATKAVIIEELQSEILSKSVDGFWNLRGYFQQLESRMVGKGKFDIEDLKNALFKWGVTMKAKYLDAIIELVDKEKNGIVDYKSFLDVLRGDISRKREEILFDVFLSLDKLNDGLVSIERIKKLFRSDDHPLSKFSGYTDEQVLSHLLKCFEINGRPVKDIDFASFVDYYSDLSVAIKNEDDEYFESIVRNNWKSDE